MNDFCYGHNMGKKPPSKRDFKINVGGAIVDSSSDVHRALSDAPVFAFLKNDMFQFIIE